MPNNSFDKEDSRVKYQSALERSAYEGSVLWSRYSAILIVNTIFIAIIGFSYSKEFDKTILQNYLFRIISPILGLLLCYLWYQVTNRGFIWMTHWIVEAAKIEEKELKGENNPLIAGKELREKIGEGVTEKASYIIILIIAIMYAFILISNII